MDVRVSLTLLTVNELVSDRQKNNHCVNETACFDQIGSHLLVTKIETFEALLELMGKRLKPIRIGTSLDTDLINYVDIS